MAQAHLAAVISLSCCTNAGVINADLDNYQKEGCRCYASVKYWVDIISPHRYLGVYQHICPRLLDEHKSLGRRISSKFFELLPTMDRAENMWAG